MNHKILALAFLGQIKARCSAVTSYGSKGSQITINGEVFRVEEGGEERLYERVLKKLFGDVLVEHVKALKHPRPYWRRREDNGVFSCTFLIGGGDSGLPERELGSAKNCPSAAMALALAYNQACERDPRLRF